MVAIAVLLQCLDTRFISAVKQRPKLSHVEINIGCLVYEKPEAVSFIHLFIYLYA